MIIEHGDLFEEGVWERDPESIIVIPANAIIKAGGKLVMGAGFAGEVSRRFASIPEIAGMTVRDVIDKNQFYGFAFITGSRFALLQTKKHYQDKSSLKLVEKSVKKMLEVIEKKKVITDFGHKVRSTGKVQFSRLHIPMPGIGKGGLDKEEVIPMLESYLEKDNRFVFWIKD